MSQDDPSVDISRLVEIVDDFTLFEPRDASNSDLRQDFEEINNEPVFKVLSSRMLRFCWYVANRTSPIAKETNQRKRLQIAVTTVWGRHWEKDIEAVKLYNAELSMPMKDAIERMAQFNPSKRLRARFIAEYSFDRMNEVIMATQKDIEGMDFNERKDYVELLQDTVKKLDSMIQACEGGWGIRIKKTKQIKRSKVTAAELSDELGKD